MGAKAHTGVSLPGICKVARIAAVSAAVGLPVISYPAHAKAPSLHAQCANVAAHPEAGIAACSRIIETVGSTGLTLAIAHFNRGIGYTKSGEFDRAIEDFTQAIHLNPQHARSFNARGYAYEMKSDRARALADFHRAIELNPAFASALGNRARINLAAKKIEQAIADANAAIRIDARYSPAFRTRGAAYEQLGKRTEAMADFNEAIRLDPRSGESLAYRALLHAKSGQQQQAVTDFRAALAAEPKHRNASIWKAQLATVLRTASVGGVKSSSTALLPRPRVPAPDKPPTRPATDASGAASISPIQDDW